MLNEILFPRRVRGTGLRILNRLAKYTFARRFLLSFITRIGGFRHRKLYRQVKKYCMFVGYPRSGHSLVGSLIDAHPKAIIAHELDALGFVEWGYSKERLFYMMQRNSHEFSKTGRSWTGYAYDVKGQWQGTYDHELIVIGDKKGGMSTQRLQDSPNLLDALEQEVDMPVYIIHVVRNPFDNISTISKRQNLDLPTAIDFYFSLCETVEKLKKEIDSTLFLEFKLEDLINDSKTIMKSVCNFLGIEAPDDYLQACADILFDRPKTTRDTSEWNDDLIKKTLERVKEFQFLKGYEYN
ncbi:MAG: sulfotransferase [Candidatus Thorarchaeota archaeon]